MRLWAALVLGVLTGCPSEVEVCNGLDDDGDGEVDEDAVDASPLFADADRDGFGLEPAGEGCPVDGLVTTDGDCDDSNDEIAPGAEELCNGIDDDCDGVVPDDESDADGDGFLACGTDCDDADADIAPGRAERCNGIDDNCDGVVSSEEADDDGDGVAICAGDCDDGDEHIFPGAPEDCDHVDDDCDGNPDWGHWVPADHATPQAALDDAPEGATVCVAEGLWDGPFVGSRGVSLVGESRDGTVLTSTILESTTLWMDGPPAGVRALTVTHAAPEARGQLVDLRGRVDVSDVTLAGPECDGTCLVLVGRVDVAPDTVWEDVLVRDLTWTGATRSTLGPGLQVEGPLTLRRVTFQDLAIRPAECGVVVRGAAVFGPRATIEDMRIERVDVDLPDCADPGVVQVEGGLVLLVPTVRGLTVRDVDVRLLESDAEATVTVRGLVARLSGAQVHDVDIEGVRMHVGGQPVVDGGLLKLDGEVDGLRIDSVDLSAVPSALVTGGLVASAPGAALDLVGLRVSRVVLDTSGDGMILAAPPDSRRDTSLTLTDARIEDVVAGDGSLVWVGDGAVDARLAGVVVRDVESGAVVRSFSSADFDVVGLTLHGADLVGPAIEVGGDSFGDLSYLDIRDVRVTASSLVWGSLGLTGHHWVLAGNRVDGTTSSALVQARGGSLQLSFATLYANSVLELGVKAEAYLLGAPTGTPSQVDHVDIVGNRGEAGSLLAADLDEARWVNRYDLDPSGWSVDTEADLLAVDPVYVDISGTDPTAWDLHLASTSTLVDAGDPTCADVDTSVCDIGAYGGSAWPE